MLAVLEPRSNTMKRGVMKDDLPGSLTQADRSFIYGAGLGLGRAFRVRSPGQRVKCFTDLDR